ncbi:MAG TPA: PA14 domain-containing protein, partial [Caldilineaceae bacterium]|nr:PA14 domain-containing protein [Caldilineaceae bacterium]
NCGENYLENRDGNLYGAHFMQGCVDQGGNRYQFAFGDPPMTAPGSSGTYHSQWQIWRWPNHIGPLIDLWFVVESSPPNCDPHPDRAILYSQTNFGGACVSLGPGDYPNPGHLNPVGNDNTRSLRVGQNVRLTLYENDNYQGRQSNFDTSEVHDLRDAEIGYDTSSARVEQKPPTATPTPPATATPTPPPDGEAPTISWIAPVADGQIYHVSGELVRLQVEATDNVSVSQVHFSRWDAVQEVVVDLVDRFSPPYQMDLDTSSLNYEWNEIRATAYDAVGNQRSATIWLFRDTVAPTPTNTPTPQTATCPGVISGWKGEYWNNESLSGSPVVCRDDASINFDWLDNPPDPRVPVNHFSARWTRTLSFPAGTYRFDVFHDDGARLYIDGVLVLDNWCDNCRVTDSIRHDLSAGNHIIRLEVRENIGWAAAWLGWQTITPPDAFHLLLPILARASAPVSLPLVNGDFDQGSGSGWREFSAHNWPVLVHSSNLPIAPYSGEWAAWLGGEYDEVAFIEQSVIVPSDSSILRFAYWIASEDQCGFDFGGVVLNGGTVVEVFDLCAAQATDNWAWRFVDLHAYAGQQVSLQIRAETDSTLNSNLFVDNVHWSSQTVNPAQITLDPQNRPTPTPIQASRHPRDLQKAATLQLFVPRADTNSILP